MLADHFRADAERCRRRTSAGATPTIKSSFKRAQGGRAAAARRHGDRRARRPAQSAPVSAAAPTPQQQRQRQQRLSGGDERQHSGPTSWPCRGRALSAGAWAPPACLLGSRSAPRPSVPAPIWTIGQPAKSTRVRPTTLTRQTATSIRSRPSWPPAAAAAAAGCC
jgi:hypothetical protein